MVIADGIPIQTWQVTVTTVAAALTPYVAYRYRQRRINSPKTPDKQLFAYYDNYVNRLELQLTKKDELIAALEKQNRDQREAYEKTIQDLEDKLRTQDKHHQEQIASLKKEVAQIQRHSKNFHKHIDRLKNGVNADDSGYDKID